jgi:hypothetical protein
MKCPGCFTELRSSILLATTTGIVLDVTAFSQP